MAGRQNSILNYFARTPKTPVTPNGTSPNPQSAQKPSTPSVSTATESIPSTPKSSRNGDISKRKSVARTEKVSTPKRIKVDESEPPKPGEFTDGDVVWAKLDGYPFWPGMVRGEQRSSSCYNKKTQEYHVQFFDKPPSRAWIRKPDVKLFKGSSDGAVPPAKNDPNWLESCRYADGVLGVAKTVRLERYWENFPEIDEGGSSSSDSPVNESKKISPVNRQTKNGKRRRAVILESEEEDEVPRTKAGKANKKDDSDFEVSGSGSEAESVSSGEEEVESEIPSEDEASEDESSKQRSKGGKKTNGTLGTPVSKVANKSSMNTPDRSTYSLGTISTPKTPAPSGRSAVVDGNWLHLTLDFLKPENILDMNRRSPDHPDYDPKTLYVPLAFKDKCTPAVRQWWELKAQNYDTVLFFKLGKFYELYHMDAVLGVQELGIDMMRGETAHCGFPEIGFAKFSSMLVDKGYKIARVEQTETPEMVQERIKKMGRATKFDKVVKRELCQVLSKGVRLPTIFDSLHESHRDHSATYLFSVITRPKELGTAEVGLCFIDTTVGKFYVAQFTDDRYFSRVRTAFSLYTPVEILHEKAKIDPMLVSMFEALTNVSRLGLMPNREFLDDSKTLKLLSDEKYFWNKDEERTEYPDALMDLISKNDHLNLTAEPGKELAVRALGAVVWYLRKCLVDHDLITMKDFAKYEPKDQMTEVVPKDSVPKHMVLDSITLKNLDVNSREGSLISKMDHCCTAFGKRLLRSWICTPLFHPDDINARLNAIDELREMEGELPNITSLLKGLPDLPRLLTKVHTLGNQHRGTEHPDSRAFFFEEAKYSKRKVQDLMTVFKAFKTSARIIHILRSKEMAFESSIMKSFIENFPDITTLLEYFSKAFDHEKAVRDGKIIPAPGVDAQYDHLLRMEEDFRYETDEYLKKITRQLLGSKVTWFGSAKNRFQMEVSDKVKVPNSFELSSSRKGHKRFVTNDTKEFLSRIQKIEASRESIVKDLMRRVFEKVDSHRATWEKAVTIIANIDVFVSLARYSLSEDMCRPVVELSDDPFLIVEDGRHPCVPFETYIPNSSQVGPSTSEHGKLVLLTGPNMGGKSTLMRQMGLLCIMAQIGSYVPAGKCHLSSVDRIFTRVGARDNIIEGESTFFIELSETSAILRHATSNSLVLIDELGRGTATHDGTGIACATARTLVQRSCRCYFSTHYHKLVEYLGDNLGVQLGHMACMVENENDEDPTMETVTFLYKLVQGACPKSYGFNAARLAGLPVEVIRIGYQKAKQIEVEDKKLELFCMLMTMKNLTLDDTKKMDIP